MLFFFYYIDLLKYVTFPFEQIFGAGVIGCKQQRAAVQLGSCACVRVSARVSGKERERVCVCVRACDSVCDLNEREERE